MSMEGSLIGLWLLSKGLMAGLAIAVPVGPVNVLCASRTLSKGRRSGLMSGFGAATADALYGAIAGFSITFLIDFLEREEFWIRVVGGMLLVGIGIMYFRKPAQEPNPQKRRQLGPFGLLFHAAAHPDQSDHGAFVSGGAGRTGDGRAARMVADVPAGGRHLPRVDAVVDHSGVTGEPVPRPV